MVQVDLLSADALHLALLSSHCSLLRLGFIYVIILLAGASQTALLGVASVFSQDLTVYSLK